MESLPTCRTIRRGALIEPREFRGEIYDIASTTILLLTLGIIAES